jgi:uncharacterized protein YifE (UPF0438 family)
LKFGQSPKNIEENIFLNRFVRGVQQTEYIAVTAWYKYKSLIYESDYTTVCRFMVDWI